MQYSLIVVILVLMSGVPSVAGADYMYTSGNFSGVFSINETITFSPTPTKIPVYPFTPSYVTCPAGCTCMGEKNAQNQGRVRCRVNGSCGVNQLGQSMYCYSDVIPTTVVTATRTPTPGVTAAPPTDVSPPAPPAATEPIQPAGGTVILSGCGPDCRCMLPDAAISLGLPLCGGTPVLCSYDAAGRAMYCYALTPQTVPLSSPTQAASGSMPALTECPAGCICLDPATARQLGLDLCGGSPLLCSYDAAGNPHYCYNLEGAAREGQGNDAPQPTGIPLGPFTTILAGASATLLYALCSRKKA